MEHLLSLAFDNLSTFDGLKIKKGIRQIETLLSKICLPDALSVSSATASPTKKDASSTSPDADTTEGAAKKPAKDLAGLSRDPAFRAFFKLQEGFEWNVAQRLLPTLEWLFTRGRRDGNYDVLIVSLLDLLQGVLLLHPPSKVLFSRQMYMNVRPQSQSSRRRAFLSHIADDISTSTVFQNSSSWTSFRSPPKSTRRPARRCKTPPSSRSLSVFLTRPTIPVSLSN